MNSVEQSTVLDTADGAEEISVAEQNALQSAAVTVSDVSAERLELLWREATKCLIGARPCS